MFTIRNKFMRTLGTTLHQGIPMAIGLTLLGTAPAFADNAVNLKVLVISTGDATTDGQLAYIKPTLDEMGVQYDVLNANTTDLTAATLSPNGCLAAAAGCVGNYNGVILTDSTFAPPANGGAVAGFTPAEWGILHNYEKDFRVREVVLSGWPGTYWDPVSPWGIYLDYGLTATTAPAAPYNATWSIPAANSKTMFEYVNQANPLAITDFAFAAKPRNDATGPRDGTIPSVTPLLKTPAGDALLSIIQYKAPLQTTPVREVMFSTITNASFLTHSQVLSYEFINWVTQGVFVGARFVYMTNHLDDLFLPNSLWEPVSNQTVDNLTYRLTSADVTNAVSKQKAFRAAHPTAGATFKLDFAFNGAGAVKDPAAATLALATTDGLVNAIMTNKNEFRYLNHTFTHADMDGQPTTPPPPNVACDYEIHTQAEIEDEINKNQTVWGLMGLPEKTENIRIMVSGNHSGLRNRNCTDYAELHPDMFNVQDDDTPFVKGANPLFIKAAANAGIEYLASDTSQLNQGTEQYITNAMIDDGKPTDRLLLPRYPTSVFYNVYTPAAMTDEYNYMFHDKYVLAGQNPCTIPAALCTTRTYNQILVAEATAAVQHMLTYNKFAHFFHQMNVAKYNTAGNTLQFDWLNAVYTAYEKLFKLPVKNPSYYQLGDMTRDRLIAKSAVINAKWNRATNQVTLSANKNVPNLLVTGIASGELYGGQSLRKINVTTTPQTIAVDQKLTQ